MAMTKFRKDDSVRYIGTDILHGIYPQSCGKVVEILDYVLLTFPHISVYKVMFDSGMTMDTLELNDNQLELVKPATSVNDIEVTEETNDIDPYEILANNWKKIVDYLDNAVTVMLEDGEVEEAIRYAILLEEAVKAWTAEEYSFDGKIKNVLR